MCEQELWQVRLQPVSPLPDTEELADLLSRDSTRHLVMPLHFRGEARLSSRYMHHTTRPVCIYGICRKPCRH